MTHEEKQMVTDFHKNVLEATGLLREALKDEKTAELCNNLLLESGYMMGMIYKYTPATSGLFSSGVFNNDGRINCGTAGTAVTGAS